MSVASHLSVYLRYFDSIIGDFHNLEYNNSSAMIPEHSLCIHDRG